MLLRGECWGEEEHDIRRRALPLHRPRCTRRHVARIASLRCRAWRADRQDGQPGALNERVARLWRTNANLLAKYGVADPDFLAPPAMNPRIGVDRDADGNIIGQWTHKAKDYSSLFS